MHFFLFFFKLGKFYSKIFLKLFSGHFSYEFFPSTILIILSLGLFKLLQNSWMFCVMNFINLTFSLTDKFFSILFSTPEILFYLLYSVGDSVSIVLVLFPRFSFSQIASVFIFCIDCISILSSQAVLFISFTCLIVLSCILLRHSFISSLKASITFTRLDLRSSSSALTEIGHPGLAVAR